MSPAPDIACFGAAHMDITARARGDFVPGASNPVETSRSHGGVVRNVAHNLALLGHRVTLVTALGRDGSGDEIMAALTDLGIGADKVFRPSGALTASYTAVLDPAGELMFGLADMAIYDQLTPDVVAGASEAQLGAALWVIDANLPQAAIGGLVARAAGQVRVAGIGVSPAKVVRLAPFLASLDVLFVNRAELRALTGLASATESEILTACEYLAGLGPRCVFLTLGANGAAAWDGALYRRLAVPGEVQDVNGAGDAFAAGALDALVAGATTDAALERGLAAGAFTAASVGSNAVGLRAATLDQMARD